MARGFAETTNMIAMVGGNPNPRHTQARYRPVSRAPRKDDRPKHMPVGKLVELMGDNHARAK